MINWLKFLPLKLRVDFDATEFQGPEALPFRPVTLAVGGSKLKLSAPLDKSAYPEPPFYVRNRDGMDEPFRSLNPAVVANDNWVAAGMLGRGWGYWRAWFGGTEGQLSLDVSVIKRSEEKQFNGPSFFHPRTLEYVIANFLDAVYGHKSTGQGKPLYVAPVNWRVHDHLPVPSASFKVEGPNNRLYFLFPIRHDTFMQVAFKYSGNLETLKDRMDATANKIIGSITLELSATAKAQLDEVRKQCPDMSLAKTFAPLKWPIKPEDIGKGEILKMRNADQY
jgi:hypothetical protein